MIHHLITFAKFVFVFFCCCSFLSLTMFKMKTVIYYRFKLDFIVWFYISFSLIFIFISSAAANKKKSNHQKSLRLSFTNFHSLLQSVVVLCFACVHTRVIKSLKEVVFLWPTNWWPKPPDVAFKTQVRYFFFMGKEKDGKNRVKRERVL